MSKAQGTPVNRDSVFVAGGQPSVTYVERAHLQIEESVLRALRLPNQIFSLAGPTKSGKTVLCRKMLADAPYVWLEGGQLETAKEAWEKICYVLNYPMEVSRGAKEEDKAEVSLGNKLFMAISGSRLYATESKRTYRIDSMASAIRHLDDKKITLVIDDFHYLPPDARKAFLRNIKGPVFDGLKLILLSVTHRGMDAVKAESELQGRVSSVIVPEWEIRDLKEIAEKGFLELNIKCSPRLIDRLAQESQGSPFLMQKLCWEICVVLGVDDRAKTPVQLPEEFDIGAICTRLSKDFGHHIYKKLEAGPQSRSPRKKRTLNSGGHCDIYSAILMAIAGTGPKSSMLYDEIRSGLEVLLEDGAPQKNEITAALKHLAKISEAVGNDAGLDWSDDERTVDISDPYLRFYLRWQIRPLTLRRSRKGWWQRTFGQGSDT